MILPYISGYVGRFKQPIQQPNEDKATMFAVSDELNMELDLILLTPGAFLDAYHFIRQFNACYYRIFVPTLRYEFISDFINLYMSLKNIYPIKWVFPDEIDHYDFSKGQIKTNTYINENNPRLSISYVPTELDGVYDIIVRNIDGVHYFCQYLTESCARELFRDREYTYIHIPVSSTVYGGLTYLQVVKLDRRYKQKFIPHSFTSIEQFNDMMNDVYIEEVPTDTTVDSDGDDIPDDYTGDISDEDIDNIFNDVFDVNGEDDER